MDVLEFTQVPFCILTPLAVAFRAGAERPPIYPN